MCCSPTSSVKWLLWGDSTWMWATCVNNLTLLKKCYFGYNMKVLDTNLGISYLKLDRNQFVHLTNQTLIGVSAITELFLTSNDNEMIDSDAFENITNLQMVTIYGNRIADLPEGLFSRNKNLRRLSLVCENMDSLLKDKLQLKHAGVRCNIIILPSDLFENSVNNRKNRLVAEHTHWITSGLFGGLSNLISISRNLLRVSPRDLFKDLNSLRFLDLSNNRSTSISSAIIMLPPMIETVWMINNMIIGIQDDNFIAF